MSSKLGLVHSVSKVITLSEYSFDKIKEMIKEKGDEKIKFYELKCINKTEMYVIGEMGARAMDDGSSKHVIKL